MPELPEIETIRRDLDGSLAKAKILDIEILFSKIIKSKLNHFKSDLLGQEISSLERRAKLLILNFKNSNKHLLFHLKMTGQLILVNNKSLMAGGHSLSTESLEKAIGGALPNKHTRLIFKFNQERVLYFNDMRKFAYAKIVSSSELTTLLANNYGPEPLSSDFNYKYLESALSRRKASIKAVLLNQKVIAGLGNIYVDEALFLTGVRPDRLASELDREEIKRLVKSINSIIKKSITHRGTTFSDYRDGSGEKGNFFRFLTIYGREKEPCVLCKTKIKKIRLAGRGTHFCPQCQK